MPLTCSPPGPLYAGARPSVQLTHWDIDGVLADPSAIEVRYGLQGDTPVTINHPNAAIVQISTGVWRFTFPSGLTAGTWWVTVEASGGGNTEVEQIKIPIRGTHV